ncbi:polysaccharide deacetylase family protein [Paenibacillus sp.]|uniref:polysaccharide deacetylase family protein n=1 Tax=Paenibacillus sp. TaxID=58172 RepID=UPI00282B6014|nr:polysaccharide deacetylase family protein [Paenibacillus sp.]MDR0266829.1 polysaccharide deacetylase family protein [Paenibacillus sp.]
MQTLLLWLFYISTFYAFIPGLITRIFGFRVFRKGSSENEYALTFDDGPDAQYTPKLLDLLKKYDAKATFFLVGSHAEQNPEVVKRMYDEGHLIGIHNYEHKSNWLMRPATVTKQIMKTDKIIHSITGERTLYYRPPWGIVNLFDLKKRGGSRFKIILWSAMFGDWREKIGADRLTERIMSKLQPGEVLLLHDCGTTAGANPDAPQQMLIALERVLQEAEQRGLKSIRIDDMIKAKENAPEKKLSRSKLIVVKLWLLWESVFRKMFRIKTVNPLDPMLHYRVRKYSGQSIELENGTMLQKGDKIVELHLDNEKLFRFGIRSRSTVHLAIQMIRSMEKEFPTLAQQIIENPAARDAKALYGVTMVNRGPEKFGFQIIDLKEGLFLTSSRIYLKFLLSVIHPSGQSRLKDHAQQLVPKMILMPMGYFIERYAESGSHRHYQESKRSRNESSEETEHNELGLGTAQGLESSTSAI